MAKKLWVLMGYAGLVAVLALTMAPEVMAQRRQTTNFQGRGVAHGAAFNQGRNASVALILEGDNFGLELTETGRSGSSVARVQYRGVVSRQSDNPTTARNFTINGRVRSFTTSTDLRVLTNTVGTCRIEVYNARVVSSNCDSVADNSSIRFLGLEQF